MLEAGFTVSPIVPPTLTLDALRVAVEEPETGSLYVTVSRIVQFARKFSWFPLALPAA